jgi:hypothetical protein
MVSPKRTARSSVTSPRNSASGMRARKFWRTARGGGGSPAAALVLAAGFWGGSPGALPRGAGGRAARTARGVPAGQESPASAPHSCRTAAPTHHGEDEGGVGACDAGPDADRQADEHEVEVGGGEHVPHSRSVGARRKVACRQSGRCEVDDQPSPELRLSGGQLRTGCGLAAPVGQPRHTPPALAILPTRRQAHAPGAVRRRNSELSDRRASPVPRPPPVRNLTKLSAMVSALLWLRETSGTVLRAAPSALSSDGDGCSARPGRVRSTRASPFSSSRTDRPAGGEGVGWGAGGRGAVC